MPKSRHSRIITLVGVLIGLYAMFLGIFMTYKRVLEVDSVTILNILLGTHNKHSSTNPFLEDARQPRSDYVRDRNARDSLLRREFNISQVS